MKHAFIFVATAFVFLIGLAPPAQARVLYAPLGGKNIGDTLFWPAGLKDVVVRHDCVAGLKTEAPTWSQGIVVTELCFSGDQAKFNEFLRGYTKVKNDRLILLLHPGKGVFTKAVLKTNSVSFNWKVVVSTDGLFNRRNGGSPKTHLSVHYHLGDYQDLAGLDVPLNIEVSAGYDGKYRQAHKGDPAVTAIDWFAAARRRKN